MTVNVWSGADLIASDTTDADGLYDVSVVEGTYDVEFLMAGYDSYTEFGVAVTGLVGTEVSPVLTAQPLLVYGYIYDEGASPIEGATVEIDCDGGLSTASDADGYYEFSCPSGEYTVGAYKTPHYTYNSAPVSGGNGDEIQQDLTLTYVEVGDISGTVKDTLEAGIGTATVTLCTSGDVCDDPMAVNGDGTYLFENIAVGDYYVIAEAADYNTKQTGVFTLSDDETEVQDLTLTKNGEVYGYVTDVDTNPLSGATIDVYFEGGLVGTAISDGDGYYEVTGLEENTYDLEVSKQYYDTIYDTVTIELANLNVEKDFEFTQTLVDIEITVYGYDGDLYTPLEGATVTINGESLPTDVDGIASFIVPAGVYDYTATMAGYDEGDRFGVIFDLDSTTDEVTLNMHGSLAGDVKKWNNSPIEGALVKAYVDDWGTVAGSSTTDADGLYTLDDISAGTYDMKSIKGGCVPISKENKVVSIGSETTVGFKMSCSS